MLSLHWCCRVVFRRRQLRPGIGYSPSLPGACDQPLQQPPVEDSALRPPLACQRNVAGAPSDPGRLRNGGAPDVSRTLAYWDTTAGYTDRGIGDTVLDTGPFRLNAEGYNRPVRAQTGWNWTGRNDCFRLGPHEFGGIEFHADALTDCRWEPTLSLTIPPDLRSGVYAVKPTADDSAGRIRAILYPSDRAQGTNLLPRPDGKLSCLRQQPGRVLFSSARSHQGLDANPSGSGHRGPQERSRVRSLDI